jgi:hypothetical protein
MAETITCPNCGSPIEVSAALAAHVRDELSREFAAQTRRREAELAEREDGLLQRERAVDQEIVKRLALAQEQLRQEEALKARQLMSLEFADLNEQLTETKTKLAEAQKTELDLRKERRALEDQKAELELSVQRRLDEERQAIREQAKIEVDEENRLRLADNDRLVAELRSQIDVLKRKSEQGAPQTQGEIMELELEDLLRGKFPHDTIEPVPVGAHGGDVLQHVHDAAGLYCGTILWEFKRTKAWSDAWLPKLRHDQRVAKAHVAVLASVETPKGVSTFTCIDDVWVTSRGCLVALAAVLRAGMVEVARTRRFFEGQHSKLDLLHSYVLTGEFRHRVEGIVEAVMTLRNDLESEIRSVQRLWAKREKQIDRAMLNTAGLYGDVGGIVGPSLPRIAHLEFAGLAVPSPDGVANEEPVLEESPF